MAAVTVEKKAAATEKARASTEKKYSDLQAKLGETKLKLAEGASVNTAWVEELANLRAALEACKNKWFNEGFTNAKNSAEPIIKDA